MSARVACPSLPRLKRGDAATLREEVERYLAAVDAFRAEGCELSWRPEWPTRRRARAAAAAQDVVSFRAALDP